MKTLYLVRHAKSDWNNGNLPDIDRPLNTRGYRDAHAMSNLMKEKKVIPDVIISSPAIRAISTALIFCRNLGLDPAKIIIYPDLYETSVKQYLECVSQIDNRFNSAMLFAHNPTITSFANSLTKAFTDGFPTCGIAGIKQAGADSGWGNFNAAPGELLWHDFPKNHSEG
ncbi:MAG: histidine phosphatase family protein [Bacteroidota bacterium]